MSLFDLPNNINVTLFVKIGDTVLDLGFVWSFDPICPTLIYWPHASSESHVTSFDDFL